MPYNANIPASTDTLNVSQQDLLNNFVSLNNTLETDHMMFDGPDAGKHKAARFPTLVAPISTANDELAVFARVSTDNAAFGAVLCLRQQNNGAISEFTTFYNFPNGWTRLPNGQLLKWQLITGLGDNALGIFPKVWDPNPLIPAFTAPPYFIMAVPQARGDNSILNRLGSEVSIVQSTVTDTAFSLWIENTSNGFTGVREFNIYVFGLGLG